MKPLFAALGMSAALAAAPVHALTLVHSNDVLGELEPCGCRTNPQGGMARKANFIKKLGEPEEIVQVDAGDLLFGTEKVPEILVEQSEVQASYLLKAMRELHHDAIVPGEKDFALGLKTFEKLRKNSGLLFLAANLKRKDGKPFLDSHKVLLKKGPDGKPVRVAIIGLVGKDLNWPKELKASDPIAQAKSIVPRLKKLADWLIVVTHEGYDADLKLAQAVPGIDVIVGAHTQTFLQKPANEGKTWILQSSFRNQYLGMMKLERPMDPANYQVVGMDPNYDSPAQAPSKMDELVHEFKQAVAELNSRREAQLTSGEGRSPASAKYQTFPRCASCHLKQFDFWRQTPHARAFNVLVEKEQSKNKECLQCHTVGLGDPKGVNEVTRLALDGEENPLSEADLAAFLKKMHEAHGLKDAVKVKETDSEPQPLSRAVASLSRSYTPVQCENCHMPGQDHPFQSGYSKTVEKSLCLKCHTPARAPEWYLGSGEPDWQKIDGKRKLITCPAGELPPEDN